MKSSLPNFTHTVGWHCSSTSISNVAKFYGVPMSEAMAFGLGAGLGFQYWDKPGGSPRYSFNGRSSALETKFFEHIGRPVTWSGEWSPKKMADAVANGRPILCVTDIYGLPYYQPQVHFPGHGVVVTEIDLETEQVAIADIASPDYQNVHWDHLKAAMSENQPPMIVPNQWVAPEPLDASIINEQAIRNALKTTVDALLRSDSADEGLHHMPTMIDDMTTKWASEAQFAWTARFGYQAIEKRGTGGGGFRKLFALFLEEAAEYLPDIQQNQIIEDAKRSASLWTDFALMLKQVFIEKDQVLFKPAQAKLKEIYAAETALQHKIDSII